MTVVVDEILCDRCRAWWRRLLPRRGPACAACAVLRYLADRGYSLDYGPHGELLADERDSPV